MQKAVESLLPFERCARPRLTIKSIAAANHTAKFTLHSSAQAAKHGLTTARAGRQTSLRESEENVIIELLADRADSGNPLFRQEVVEVAEAIVEKLPVIRKNKIPFKNGRPGKDRTSLFVERHPSVKLGRSSNNEEFSYRHFNADALSNQIETIEKIRKRTTYHPEKLEI